MQTNQRGASLPVFTPHEPTRKEVYDNELKSVLTRMECAKMFNRSPDTVKLDIQSGRLYAEKRGEHPENNRSGIWLIPFTAANDLYGSKKERVYHDVR